ncbi:hypothetical protein [Arthrobacter sp. Z4-13]
MSTDQSNKKYEWQAWPPDTLEGMPPKRRRLAVWGMWWFFLLGALLASALDALEIPQPWRTLLALTASAAVFGPLIRGVVRESSKLRAEGIVLPSFPITRKTLISMTVITAVLWIAFVFLVAIGRHTFPLLPILGTIWLAYQFCRQRSERQRTERPAGLK